MAHVTILRRKFQIQLLFYNDKTILDQTNNVLSTFHHDKWHKLLEKCKPDISVFLE